MSVNKIETANIEFEVSDDIYDIIIDLLKRESNVIHYQQNPSTVELNTFTVKFALEHLKSIFKTGTPIIVEFEQAISKAESKDPQPTKADQHVDRLKTAIAGLQNDRSNIIKVLNSVQDRVNNLEDRLSPVTAKAQTQVPVNTPALSIQDQVNELRKEVRDVQTRLSEIASTVSRSNLSQHIRLGGVEPNNL